MKDLFIFLGTIVGLLLLNLFTILIATFFGFNFKDYGIYLLWLNAIGVFFIILPKGQTNIFKNFS